MSSDFGRIPDPIPGKPAPFFIHVADQDLRDLKTLLDISRIAPRTWWNGKQDGSFGVSRDWLIDAKDTWLHHFDWRQQEAEINSFPNFKMTIDCLEHGPVGVHFLALFSERADATPIILMHGWPGSFIEFLPMLHLLRTKYTPKTLPYNVIVPSLPGYGFSTDIGHDKEFTLDAATRAMNQLMIELGFGKGYVAQGGDVGSMISLKLLKQYEECKATHGNANGPVNFLSIKNYQGSTDQLTSRELKHLERAETWRATGMAYALEHGTRPATIGLVLSSNPLALLAWIGEKIMEWTDEQLPLNTILANVSLYWFTSTFPRSLYPYRGLASFSALDTDKAKPLGYSCFPGELVALPKAWATENFPNLVQYTTHDKGGHFAAWEQPQSLLQDVEEFIVMVGSTFLD